MPAVSVSAQISQAIYFLAVITLAAVLAKPVYGVYTASQERGAQVTAAGIGSMLNSLSPGESAAFRLDAYPGVALSASLSGTTVKVSEGRATCVFPVRWSLPSETLEPGVLYAFTLDGTSIASAVVGENG
jgi:hypothetical protein